MKMKIWLPLLLVYVIWGSTYLAIHFAVSTIPPFLMAGTRFLIAGTILYGWRRLAGDPAPTKRQWFSSAVIGLLLLFGGTGMLSLAEQQVPSGVAAVMIGSVPLWMAVIETIRPGGVRPNWLGALGLLIGFGGIVLLVGPSFWGRAHADLNPMGIGILLVAALSWSLGSIFSPNADLPAAYLLSTGMEMLAGGLGCYVAASFKGEWHSLVLARVAPSSWLGLAYLIVFGSMVGFTAYAWLLRNAPLPLVSTYAYVNPLVAILLGSVFAHELMTARILMAALIIVGSVVVINISRQMKLPARSAEIGVSDG